MGLNDRLNISIFMPEDEGLVLAKSGGSYLQGLWFLSRNHRHVTIKSSLESPGVLLFNAPLSAQNG